MFFSSPAPDLPNFHEFHNFGCKIYLFGGCAIFSNRRYSNCFFFPAPDLPDFHEFRNFGCKIYLFGGWAGAFFQIEHIIWEVRSRKKNNLNIFYLKKWHNLQKARICSQNCEIHGNLGGQEPGTKKNNLNIFYLKKYACPTSKKLDFAAKIAKFLEIWEVRSRGRKRYFIRINALTQLSKIIRGRGRQAEVGMALSFFLDRCGPGFLLVFQFYLQISGF